MRYRVDLSKLAKKQLKRLDSSVQERVLAAIEELADTPRPNGYLKMTDANTYRIRVGAYRVVYEIHDQIVTVWVLEVGHRSDIYR